MAAVFELCLVGVMVAFELLGYGKAPASAPAAHVGVAREPDQAVEATQSPPVRPALPPPRKTRGTPPTAGKPGSTVKAFLRDHLFPADGGERLDIMAMVRSYRAWCKEKGLSAADLDTILDEIEKLCGKIGVKIEPGNDQRVYVHGVKIETPILVGVS